MTTPLPELPPGETSVNSKAGKQEVRPAVYRTVSLRFDTLLLTLLAGVTLTVARASSAWNPTLMVIRCVCEFLVAVVGTLIFRRLSRKFSQERVIAAIAVGAAALYPFAIEFTMRQLADGSEPLEMLLLTSLHLAAIALAVFSHLPRLGGTSVLLSSFLLLFATTIASSPLTLALAGVYGAMGLWWLMGAYWDRLADTFVASKVQRRIPMRVSVIGVTTIVLLVLGALIGMTKSGAIALAGFMPTSGGTRWYDPNARSGVGDGDAMVAAKEEAMSFGPVESELFLESKMPSLYDMFNEAYGEPYKKKKQERAIALAPEKQKDSHQRMAKTERSGREFSAVRRKRKRKHDHRKLDDRKAPAMMYVLGRVPLHLALERFDTFNGRKWTHSGVQLQEPSIRMETQYEKPWAYVMGIGSSSIHRFIESHAVKVINLKTNRYPSPPQLTAVHIDKVDQSDYFGWTDDSVAYMPIRDHIPQLTVVHLRSQGVNLQTLREADFTARYPKVSKVGKGDKRTPVDLRAEHIARHLLVPDACGTVAQLAAAAQVHDVPRGWRQVEAVVDWLRRDFTFDPQAETPEECEDVVTHFLEARRGPDYLFATTAAILLRELGYPTRVVSGFYADETRYDHRAGQTAVLAEDVHFWVEVNIDGLTWASVEPTPGYEPPHESLTWQQYLAEAWNSVCVWVGTHFFELTLGLAVAVAGWLMRIYWLDAVLTLICRICGAVDSGRRVLWTMRLLEWRAWLAGYRRPGSKTLSHWYGGLGESLPEATETCLQIALRSAESLLYRSDKSQLRVAPTQELQTACAVVERGVGTSCFRRAFKAGPDQ